MGKFVGCLTATVCMERGELGNDRTIFSDQENIGDKITPERARLILQRHGLDVSLEQADAILAFLRRFAMLTLAQIFDK
jgi:hypothetical protein